eukprot:3204003-Amphidinium_carterae.1
MSVYGFEGGVGRALGMSGWGLQKVRSASGADVRHEKTADGIVVKISGAPDSVNRARQLYTNLPQSPLTCERNVLLTTCERVS